MMLRRSEKKKTTQPQDHSPELKPPNQKGAPTATRSNNHSKLLKTNFKFLFNRFLLLTCFVIACTTLHSVRKADDKSLFKNSFDSGLAYRVLDNSDNMDNIDEGNSTGSAADTKHKEGTTNTIMTTTTDEIKKVMLQSALSPLCNPTLPPEHTPIKRIVFGHMRKAGGTTIMSYLRKVKKTYKLQLVSYEGGCIERPGTRNDTLYITHIRNPVERAITHFKYSERWDCECLVGKKKKICPPTWKPTEENAKSMEEWLKQGDGCQWRKVEQRLWHCSSNCFIKWLNHQNHGHDICADKPGSHHSVNSSHYQSALGTAKKFHLIIQTEKLRDEEYVESLENYFGVASTFTEKKIPMYCDKESKAANGAYPHNMTDTARTLLIGMNTEDNHFFKELSTCPDGIQFPKGSLGDIVHSKKPNVEGELKAKQVGDNNARTTNF